LDSTVLLDVSGYTSRPTLEDRILIVYWTVSVEHLVEVGWLVVKQCLEG